MEISGETDEKGNTIYKDKPDNISLLATSENIHAVAGYSSSFSWTCWFLLSKDTSELVNR